MSQDEGILQSYSFKITTSMITCECGEQLNPYDVGKFLFPKKEYDTIKTGKGFDA